MNAYEALLQGRPMITWPNELFTGRILFGLYKIADSKLLLDNLVARNADEYAEKAVTLANDKALAKELSEEIVRCLPRIFGPEGLLEPIVSFYKMALERADAGLSPADWYHGQWMTRKDLLLHVDER